MDTHAYILKYRVLQPSHYNYTTVYIYITSLATPLTQKSTRRANTRLNNTTAIALTRLAVMLVKYDVSRTYEFLSHDCSGVLSPDFIKVHCLPSREQISGDVSKEARRLKILVRLKRNLSDYRMFN